MLEINIKIFENILHFSSAVWHLPRDFFDIAIESLNKAKRLKKHSDNPIFWGPWDLTLPGLRSWAGLGVPLPNVWWGPHETKAAALEHPLYSGRWGLSLFPEWSRIEWIWLETTCPDCRAKESHLSENVSWNPSISVNGFTNEVGTKVCKMSLVLGQCDCDDLHTCTLWGGCKFPEVGQSCGVESVGTPVMSSG